MAKNSKKLRGYIAFTFCPLLDNALKMAKNQHDVKAFVPNVSSMSKVAKIDEEEFTLQTFFGV